MTKQTAGSGSADRKQRAMVRRMVRTKKRLGDEDIRQALRDELQAAYTAGASIRQLAAARKLAFGTVRTLLLEAGITLRSRGGPNHTRHTESGAASSTTNKRG